MKFSGNQRRIYQLALGLLILAIALVCAWSLWLRPSDDGVGADPGAEPSAPVEATPVPQDAATGPSSTIRTTTGIWCR